MRRVFINILSGALGFILPAGLNLIFTPLIIKHLGSEAYGLQSLVNVIIGFLMVADMGLDIPVTQLVAECQGKKDFLQMNMLLNTSLKMYLIIGIFGCAVIGVFSPTLINYAFKVPPALHDQGVEIFYLAAVGFTGSLLNMWGRSIFNGILRYDVSNAIDVTSTLLSLAVGTLLVIKGYGVVQYVFVRVFFTFLSGITYFLLGKKFLPKFKVSWKIDSEIYRKLKTQIGYGFFLRIAGILTSRLDQTLIGIWIGVAAVGYYTIPILISTSLTGLVVSMVHYIFPSISELNGKGEVKKLEKLFIEGTRLTAILSFFLVTPCLIFANKFLSIWIGVNIASHASNVLVLLLIAILIQLTFVTVVNNYIVGIGKLKFFTKYTTIRGAVMAICCVILIRAYGIMGAGWAMVATTVVDIGLFSYIVKKYFNSSILKLLLVFYFKLLIVCLVSGILIEKFFLSKVYNWGSLILGGAIFFCLFVCLSIIIRIWNDNDIYVFKTFKNKIYALLVK